MAAVDTEPAMLQLLQLLLLLALARQHPSCRHLLAVLLHNSFLFQAPSLGCFHSIIPVVLQYLGCFYKYILCFSGEKIHLIWFSRPLFKSKMATWYFQMDAFAIYIQGCCGCCSQCCCDNMGQLGLKMEKVKITRKSVLIYYVRTNYSCPVAQINRMNSHFRLLFAAVSRPMYCIQVRTNPSGHSGFSQINLQLFRDSCVWLSLWKGNIVKKNPTLCRFSS